MPTVCGLVFCWKNSVENRCLCPFSTQGFFPGGLWKTARFKFQIEKKQIAARSKLFVKTKENLRLSFYKGRMPTF